MIALIRRLYYVFAYYLSWLVFGLVGLSLNLVCAPMLLLPHSLERAEKVRRAIQSLFKWWLRWLHMVGVVQVAWHGFEETPLRSGTVYVANHPTLVDATFLLAKLPDTICIFKPSLMRNPTLGPAAIMADYASGITGVDVIRTAAQHVIAGGSLLIFPEGTRTGDGVVVGSFKGGFALVAERAKAPVRLISIRSTGELCTRERPWWLAPSSLPTRIDLTLEREWLPDATRRASALAAEVEQESYARLSGASS